MIKKTSTGWRVDIQPGGRCEKRFRKLFALKADALRYESWLKTKITQNPEWMPASKDTRRLSDLVEVWQKHHGINLRAKNTYSRLINLCRALGNPTADTFNVNLFVGYRSQRLNQGISANNLNREHAYLRAMFNELRRLGYWKKENPLALVRQFKIEERELSYLTLEQISTLLAELGAQHNRDAWLITRICLATGSRWSEAEGLRVSHVRNGQIHFTGTKSGKNRSVPINDELVSELNEHLSRRYGDERSTDTRYFQYAYSAFRETVKRVGLTLPKGQSTHVLRHTFASHFMMNGGNILTLQRILGHGSLTMTMRYAHLAPEHLQEAKNLNPLARLTLG